MEGLDENGQAHTYGKTRESPWRQPRSACGAIVGTLASYNADNAVHRRIRADLGEANFEYLSKNKVMTTDGKTEITAAIAAAIVAIQGLLNTAKALTTELDERGVGHVTASITVNMMSTHDPVIYLARATVYGGTLTIQGLGTDAKKYSGVMENHGDSTRLQLTYDRLDPNEIPLAKTAYKVIEKSFAHDPKEHLF